MRLLDIRLVVKCVSVVGFWCACDVLVSVWEDHGLLLTSLSPLESIRGHLAKLSTEAKEGAKEVAKQKQSKDDKQSTNIE